MISSDFHIHTTYCDGISTVDEVIKRAVSLNLSAIGFSSHEYTSVDESYCMKSEDAEKYVREIAEKKEEYREKIEIYLGTERDLFSDKTDISYDYAIGSVHYINVQGEIIPVDENEEIMQNCVREFFGGDYLRYAAKYYETVFELSEKRDFDIFAHLDLVTKFNEGNRFFDTTSKEYQKIVLGCIDEIIRTDRIFEINTGAISRGIKTTPYPDGFILKTLLKKGARIILSSDSHRADTLCYKFDEMIKLLKTIGFKSVVTLKNSKFTDIGI